MIELFDSALERWCALTDDQRIGVRHLFASKITKLSWREDLNKPPSEEHFSFLHSLQVAHKVLCYAKTCACDIVVRDDGSLNITEDSRKMLFDSALNQWRELSYEERTFVTEMLSSEHSLSTRLRAS